MWTEGRESKGTRRGASTGPQAQAWRGRGRKEGLREERKKEEGEEREKLEWNDNRRRRSVVDSWGVWVGVRWGG